MPAITIRAAGASDAATIVRLIRALAAYEGLLAQVRITEAACCATASGRDRASSACSPTSAAKPSALLFVAENVRGLGIVRRLMARLAAIARERGCSRMSLSVLHWNPARSFYDRLGFTQIENWLPYQLSGDALARLAAEAS